MAPKAKVELKRALQAGCTPVDVAPRVSRKGAFVDENSNSGDSGRSSVQLPLQSFFGVLADEIEKNGHQSRHVSARNTGSQKTLKWSRRQLKVLRLSAVRVGM